MNELSVRRPGGHHTLSPTQTHSALMGATEMRVAQYGCFCSSSAGAVVVVAVVLLLLSTSMVM